MKQCLLMCLFTVHTVHVFSFFPFFYSLFFPSVVYSNRRNLWPKALIFLMYILTHLQTIINQCRNGVSDNYSTKSKKKLEGIRSNREERKRREWSSNEYKMNMIDENKLVNRHQHPLFSGCTLFNCV